MGGPNGDGGLAINAGFSDPHGIAVGPDGSLYIADTYGYRVRRIAPNGRITSVAGGGSYEGDGGQAKDTRIVHPSGIAFGPDGSMYISESTRIRRVGPDGIVGTVAGSSNYGYSGDGGLAISARFHGLSAIVYSKAGHVYVVDKYNDRIRRVRSPYQSLANGEFMVSSGRGETHVFDFAGRHKRTLDNVSGALHHSFAYDALGYLSRVEDESGNATVIERDAAGKPTAIIAPDGQRTELILDPNGYLANVTNPAGEVHGMTYTASGLLTGFTKPGGAQSVYTYDALGRLVSDRDAVGGGWTLARTKTENGFESRMTSAEGRTSRFAVERLDATDVLRTTTAPDGTVDTRRIITTATQITETATAADGTVSTVRKAPDPRFRMEAPYVSASTITTPGGISLAYTGTRQVTLAKTGEPMSLTSLTQSATVNGRTSITRYDAATRTWTSTSAGGRMNVMEVDEKGHPVMARFADLAVTYYSYDTRGRVSEIHQGEGEEARTMRFAYDERGNLANVTDDLGRTTAFEYDAAGRVTTQTLPDGRHIAYTYDANGNLTRLTPPGREAHVFTYTPVDLEEAYTPPDLAGVETVTHYRYNRDKQLTAIERPDGKTVSLSYDTGGRLDSTTLARGSYRYDYHPKSGQLGTLTAPDGNTLSYTYDGFLPLSETAAGEVNGTVSRTYDNNFRVKRLAVNGQAVDFGYDNDGLLTSAGSLSLSRDPANGLITDTVLGAVATQRTYNSFGELDIETATVNGEAVMTTAYTRDTLGRITAKVETIGGTTTTYGYGYDQAGRLEKVFTDGVLTATYTYDPNGNRLSKVTPNGAETGTYDAQDRMLTYGGASYEYTANGELMSKTENGATTHYVYDELGNLTQVRLPGDVVIDYLIDGRNRRIGKKVNGKLVQGFLYQDQLEPVAELDGDGNVVARFIYCSEGHVPDYMEKVGKTYRIVSDHLGSPRLVVDTTTGEVAQRMAFDEFGNLVENTNSGLQPFGFAGGIFDLHTPLVRFGARDYDENVGRWTAKDPIGFNGGDTDLYAYVLSNPLTYIDPLGLDVTAIINRTAYTANSIGGTIDVTSTNTDTSFSGYTLENRNPPNPNLPVPPGTYSSFVRTDHTPSRVELIGVPNASAVQIHVGNTALDVIGCFAVGTTSSPDFVGGSVNAMNIINRIIAEDGTGNITVIVNGATEP